MARWDTAALGFATGFLQGFMGEKQRSQKQEQELLMSAITNAVQTGTPEALNLLNVDRLAAYGLDQFLPMYQQLATKVGQQKQLEMRRAQASTKVAESQARVAAGTEQSQIQLAGSQAKSAEQKVEMGTLDLTNAQTRQRFLDANPRLLMLPEDKQIAEIQNYQSQIQTRKESTALQWAQLNESKRMHDAQIGELGSRRLIEKMKFDLLQGTSPEEQKSLLFPGFESSIERTANQFRQRLDSGMKVWEAVREKINAAALKEGKEPLVYKTEDAALDAMTRLNQPAKMYNDFAEQAEGKIPGFTVNRLPEFDLVKDPGLMGDEWRLVIKSGPSLQEKLEQFRRQFGTQAAPTTRPTMETPKESGGGIIDPEKYKAIEKSTVESATKSRSQAATVNEQAIRRQYQGLPKDQYPAENEDTYVQLRQQGVPDLEARKRVRKK